MSTCINWHEVARQIDDVNEQSRLMAGLDERTISTGKDTRRRSLLKAVTWRLIGVFVLVVVSFAITGSWRDTELIVAVYAAIQVVLFYVHERAWQRIGWGKR